MTDTTAEGVWLPEAEPYTMPTHDELRAAAEIVHRARMAREKPDSTDCSTPHVFHRDAVMGEALNAGWQALTCLAWEARQVQ